MGKKGFNNFEKLINEAESCDKTDRSISNRKSKVKIENNPFEEANSNYYGEHYSLNLEKLTERIEHSESYPLNFFKT